MIPGTPALGWASPGDDYAEEITAHSLDHGIAIYRRGKPWPHRDDGRSHVARGAQIALGQDRVHHSCGLKLAEHLCLGVHHHGDIPRLGNLKRLGWRPRQASTNALDLDLAQANGLAKTDRAADARGNRDIGHDQPTRRRAPDEQPRPWRYRLRREHKRAFPGHLPVLRFDQSKSGSAATLMIISYRSIIRR